MSDSPCAVFLFVDGLGMGSADPAVNPLQAGAAPNLVRLVARHGRGVDAQLGVRGLPQSATGQTALLTGVNAAQVMGRHVEGFPGPQLKGIIEEHNIYRQLAALGVPSTYANAYYVDDMRDITRSRIQSVTTVAALSAFGRVRDRADLEADRAVYHDLTRESLRSRGYCGPTITPEQAAAHLCAVAAGSGLTLFEFFLTDRAGHQGDMRAAQVVLAGLDRFVGALLEGAGKSGMLVALCSDHGNVEDASTRGHTVNPVPFAAVGEGAETLLAGVQSILDVTPALVGWFGRRAGGRQKGEVSRGL